LQDKHQPLGRLPRSTRGIADDNGSNAYQRDIDEVIHYTLPAPHCLQAIQQTLQSHAIAADYPGYQWRCGRRGDVDQWPIR